MTKVAQYLQEHLLGEVTDNLEIRRYFSKDASILQLAPSVVVYPRDENDVRKTARFVWQLAKRGRGLPITARGGGSNTSGAGIGSGILLVFTAHMNKLLMFNAKKGFVIVEPGATYDKLEQTLYTHGLFLPPYPASSAYATIGGGIATNATGEKSVKYGATGKFVQQLRIVLANGEVIETGPLNRRELDRKMGLATLEGAIYRSIDGMLEENAELIEIEKARIKSRHNAMGYNLSEIKSKKDFDLTPLFIGSQGTLGIISEATLEVVPYNPITATALLSLKDLKDLHDVLPRLLELKPSMIEMLNRAAVDLVRQINPSQLARILENHQAAIHLFIEFDDSKGSDRKTGIKRVQKIAEQVEAVCQVASEPADIEKLRKIRQSVSAILAHPPGPAQAVPVAEDVCVPVDKLAEFLEAAGRIYESNHLPAAAWGQAGDGIVRMQPMVNLGQVGDRQKLLKVSDEIFKLVKQLAGSLSAAAGDGRIRAPYSPAHHSPEFHNLTLKVKKIFDPYGLLNPGVKTASFDDVKKLMRTEYNLAQFYEHLPRS